MSWMEKDLALCCTTMQKQVVHWNKVAGNEQRDLEVLQTCQSALVREELGELVEAYHNKDRGEFIKELCDALVVSLYEWHLHSKDLAIAIHQDSPQRGLALCMSTVEACLEEQNTIGVLPLLVRAFEIANADRGKAWKAVMDNNYSKFIGSWEISRLEMSLEKKHPHARLDRVDGYSVLKDPETGKVLKPYGYQKLTNMREYCYE